MPNSFEILTRFLARFGDEVEGRESSPLPPEVDARLKSFARGQLAESEQAELVAQLDKHPEWVATLAAEVRALRN